MKPELANRLSLSFLVEAGRKVRAVCVPRDVGVPEGIGAEPGGGDIQLGCSHRAKSLDN
jgi:hypothetical protein